MQLAYIHAYFRMEEQEMEAVGFIAWQRGLRLESSVGETH